MAKDATDLKAVKCWPSLSEVAKMTITFLLAVVGWVIFRSDNMDMTLLYFERLCTPQLWCMPYLTNKVFIFLPLLIMIGMEWFNRTENHGLAVRGIHNKAVRYCIYFILSLLIIINMGPQQNFIYFQF